MDQKRIKSPEYEKQLSLDCFPEESKTKLTEYICPLCKGVYVNPILDTCAHAFCKKCFQTYSDYQRKINPNGEVICPLGHCPIELQKVQNFELMCDMMKDYLIYCPNREKGCDWIGNFSLKDKHIMDKCPCQIIQCKNPGCKYSVIKSDLPKHEEECEFALIICGKCEIKIKKGEIESHVQECPKEKVKCICEKELIREGFEYHLKNECIEQDIDCDFYIYGCKERFKRKKKLKHFEDNIREHNELFIQWYIKQKEKLNLYMKTQEEAMIYKKEKVKNYYEQLKQVCSELGLNKDF